MPLNYKIGIDPGVNTGVAIVEGGNYVSIQTSTITKAMKTIDILIADGQKVELYVEDPNTNNGHGKNTKGKTREQIIAERQRKAQGAGSVKRDYSIWKTYCKENNITMHPIHVRTVGSQFDNDLIFKSATKWLKKCSIHARDAARMVYKFIK